MGPAAVHLQLLLQQVVTPQFHSHHLQLLLQAPPPVHCCPVLPLLLLLLHLLRLLQPLVNLQLQLPALLWLLLVPLHLLQLPALLWLLLLPPPACCCQHRQPLQRHPVVLLALRCCWCQAQVS